MTAFKEGQKTALNVMAGRFAAKADGAQEAIEEAIRESRRAKELGDHELAEKYQKDMSEAMSRKIGYMNALQEVITYEKELFG